MKSYTRFLQMADGIIPAPIGERINVRADEDKPLLRVLKSIGYRMENGIRWLRWNWQQEVMTERHGSNSDCGYSGITEKFARELSQQTA